MTMQKKLSIVTSIQATRLDSAFSTPISPAQRIMEDRSLRSPESLERRDTDLSLTPVEFPFDTEPRWVGPLTQNDVCLFVVLPV